MRAVFAPADDMEALMRANGEPLFALESGDPIKDFDMIGFTMQYELSYTNILNMLDLAGVPLRAGDRKSLTPLWPLAAPAPATRSRWPSLRTSSSWARGKRPPIRCWIC